MKNEIFWKNPGYKVRPALSSDIQCDYLIVGGGITGVSAAYFLATSGAKNIVLVDKHTIGSGATGKAAGTLVTRGETDLVLMMRQYGNKKTLILWQKIREALRKIKNVIDKEHIDCDAQLQDALICGFRGENWNNLYKEYAIEKSIDSTTKLLEGEDLKKEINTKLFNHGLLSKGHAISLNPLKFIQGFSQAVGRYGVTIYENTAVLETADNNAKTHLGNITYKKIIWAVDVDYPEKNIKNLKTTVIVTRALTQGELVKIGFGERKKVVWDSHKNENYFKVTKDGRILAGFGGVIVGKHHKKTDPHLPHLKKLQSFIKKIFPYLNLQIEYAWSGHFGVNTHYSQGPFVSFKENEAVISGAATQVVCFLTAEHVVKKLLGRPSKMDDYF